MYNVSNGGVAMIFDYINAFMHLIFENEDIFITTLFYSPETFSDMSHWLKQQDIHFQWIEEIDPSQLNLVIGRKNVHQIESLLHISIQEELNEFKNVWRQYTHHILIPGSDPNNPVNQAMLDENFIAHIQTSHYNKIYTFHQLFVEDRYLFTNPTKSLNHALYYADKWPGLLKINKKEFTFVPIDHVDQIQEEINCAEFDKIKDNDTYFIHLSDLHLGTKKNNAGKIALLRSLDQLFSLIQTKNQAKVLITGDLMNTPNRKNMYLASGLMNDLKKRYHVDITFILGNHDVIVHGLNFLRVQKAKVVAYLLGESIKVLENEKIILIKINSAREGNFARGKVGKLQLQEIDEELKTIPNLHEYQLMVMIHHHILPITKAEFLKKKWNEGRVVGKLLDTSKELVDSDMLIQWLEKRHIHYVLHGHKHIPFFRKYRDIYFVSCGSSCGVVKEESKLKYLSYNVLKYNNDDHQMKVCLIYYDSALENEGKRIELHLIQPSR